MSQINRPPVGLQGLLGSKNFGQNPSDLAQQVIPTVEMFPFWASQTLKFMQETGTSSGTGSILEAQVPDGKSWGVVAATFTRETADTADNISLAIAIDENLTGAEYYIVAEDGPLTATHADILELNCLWQPNFVFWLPPLYVIRGINNGDAGSTDWRLDVITYEVDV